MWSRFEVEFLDEVVDFLSRLPEKDRIKIIYNIDKSRFNNDPQLFKKLNDEIWEFRTVYNGKYYRLFAFWLQKDQHLNLVIVTNGLIKKSNKTPKNEIEKAENIRIKFIRSKS